MATKFQPYEETSVDMYIDTGKILDISESTIAFKSKVDDKIIIPYHNVITKFYKVLKDYIVDVTLSDEELHRYYQQPKLFCYDTYGTPELTYSLLYINNMPSITEFKKKKIKVFTDDILDIVNELMALNEEDLKNNSDDVRL